MTTQLPTTRKEAKELGVTNYFTGEPCKHGHTAPRNTKSGNCLECSKSRCLSRYYSNKEVYFAASKAWREANPEKVRESNRARSRTWRAAHPGANARAISKWTAKHPEANISMKRRWKKANPEAVAICWAKRRERKASSPSPEQRAEMLAIYKECRQRNADAGFVAFHVDHIIPLAKGGAHLPENLQILPAEENLRKGAKLPAQM